MDLGTIKVLALKGEKGDAGDSYDDTEVRSLISAEASTRGQADSAEALARADADDLLSARMDALVASGNVLTQETTLYDGEIHAVKDLEFTLDADPSDFDYIDVYFVFFSKHGIHTFPSDEFVGDAVYLERTNLTNDVTGVSRLEVAEVGFEKVSQYVWKIKSQQNWYWTGSSSSDASQSTDANVDLYIYKIVGRKIISNTEVADIRVGYDGTTYDSAGEAVRTQIEEAMTSGSTFTSEIKQALLQLAEKVAYIDENGQDYYDDLYDALYPPVPATSIVLSTDTIAFTSVSGQYLLTATVLPADTTDTVVWTTSDDSVAVMNNGYVVPVANGTCTITATAGSVSATCAVTVTNVGTTYAVTNSLTHCSSSNNAVVAESGGTYTATISADSGYLLMDVTVTMNGEDVTSNVYSDGVISISFVTGDITVYAEAKAITIVPVTWAQGGLGNTGNSTSYDANRYANYYSSNYIPMTKNQTLVLYNTDPNWTNKHSYNGTDYMACGCTFYQVTGTDGNNDGSYIYPSIGYTTEGSVFTFKSDETVKSNYSKTVAVRLYAYNMDGYTDTAVVGIVDGV